MLKKIHDISVKIDVESIDYPGDPLFYSKMISSLENGDDFNLSEVSMSSHIGTHIDFPLHFYKDGKSSSDYEACDLILDSVVIEVVDRKRITESDLDNINIEEGSAVLFKTDNSISGSAKNGQYSKDYVYLDKSAAQVLVTRGVSLVGIDYNTIDGSDCVGYPVHNELLKNGILILEGICLSEINAGKYKLFAMPLKVVNLEASPVRAVLIET